MSLLEQEITRKTRKFSVPEFELGNNKEYKVEAIQDSPVYAKKADGYLPRLYYLVAWEGYPEEENTWELSSAVLYLLKIVNTFHKNHLEQMTATSAPLEGTPSMASQQSNSLQSKSKDDQLDTLRSDASNGATKKRQ